MKYPQLKNLLKFNLQNHFRKKLNLIIATKKISNIKCNIFSIKTLNQKAMNPKSASYSCNRWAKNATRPTYGQ